MTRDWRSIIGPINEREEAADIIEELLSGHARGQARDHAADLVTRLRAASRPVGEEGLRDILDRVPATALALQYSNPNVREDAYNKGVRDLADAIAAEYAALAAKPAPETPEA